MFVLSLKGKTEGMSSKVIFQDKPLNSLIKEKVLVESSKLI